MKTEDEIESWLRDMKPVVSDDLESRAKQWRPLDESKKSKKVINSRSVFILTAFGVAVLFLISTTSKLLPRANSTNQQISLPMEMFTTGTDGRHVLGDDGNLYYLYTDSDESSEQVKLLSTVAF